MPPFILLIAGAIGAFMAAKWIRRESRRVNAELRAAREQATDSGEAVRLRRRPDGSFGPG
ncbi:MAG: hypothetical protein IT538_09265 [Variibacter sp.]|nr:hypothetical protein [Variibacter sp.]